MAVWQYPNSVASLSDTPSGTADTTLNNGGTMNSGDTSVIVNSLPAGVSAAPFVMRIDSEWIKVGAIGGTGNKTWSSLTRGFGGSTAASHVNGSDVYLVLLGEMISQGQAPADASFITGSAESGLSGEIVYGTSVMMTGVYASRPAANSVPAGACYYATDSPIWARSDGTNWTEFFGSYKLTNDTFPSTWVNQGSATSDTAKGGVYLEGPATAGNDWHFLVKTAPATPYTITMIAHRNQAHYAQVAAVFRESSSGKLALLDQYGVATSIDSRNKIGSDKFNSPTSFSANYTALDAFWAPLMWYRLQDNGTNRILSYSLDGIHFITFHTVGRTDFLTANEVGFGVNANGTTAGPVGLWVLSWDES